MRRELINKIISKPIINLVLLIVTFFTTTLMGLIQWSYSFFVYKGTISLTFFESPDTGFFNHYYNLLAQNSFMVTESLKYSGALLIFLLAHELGHYLACRYYGVQATLPFLIPIPAGFGTLGAIIKIRAPIPNKKVLFDIGIAGPLAGFAALLPALYYGMSKSIYVARVPMDSLYFGEPILWKFMEKLLYPDLGGNLELAVHPVTFAAWFGLLATSLNLMPLGQLDGGHIAYALFGRKAFIMYKIFFVFILLLFFAWPYWLVWVIVGWFIGLKHPPVMDETEPVGRGRIILAIIAALILIVSFIVIPVEFK
ncbi:MAG: hypothetical protein A2Y62_06675 [Candidatus Fischerbacteria bacterium RBG_13_37_8]|uniref:Peptidase M50 domain-containing protein n=1 Tax=Candidatus Fischerbacteria bacterium RBG_13_37_8 TaxID=1817863 RepID=A0A1F5VM72_9BACT|nr:MAG: hypothetical protein A2Y62_06675 [Candidatus Fischerbacteria bacterium RBG_13_37_8]